ncbi:MAG: winged helix family two component transcriptional regulator, two-component system, OmpR family, response regulator [Candidatus Peregrinibacteria bacterium GW2011_GWE2_39_6]|nr:MAG: winged helix family two component transcriptional regulator, two-component system, OmpR family, response regulator [Candidatus Peregrinibacteria bacterium GW2011_GWF2_39_17]KKR26207.1 MAG: winged helix family two component transcriptional regulator, two-component system, OmpR family, response regulator [Candidatus Peregrinibacteria bacterium GW2011_GWE2_39_6]HCW32092.1 hypothetical protein [Candidatus Peregrinibacteria bacterium]
MHILIINYHPLHTQFIQKSLRYENIKSDICQPENLLKIWYGQYDALILPLVSWNQPPFSETAHVLENLGQIPTIITAKTLPPDSFTSEFGQHKHWRFIESRKPFYQIVTTINSLLKNSIIVTPRDKITLGKLKLDTHTHEVHYEDKQIPLRNKEFELLECLMRNAGAVLTRTFLLESVWDCNASILSNTVDVHVSRLRRKICNQARHNLIVTIPCVGYKFPMN